MTPLRLIMIGLVLLAGGVYLMSHLIGQQDVSSENTGPTQFASPAQIDSFLVGYNEAYRHLWTAAEGANWDANTDISETNTQKRIAAAQALADYVGSREIIEKLRQWRSRPDLGDLQKRQIEAAWRKAAHYPGTTPDLVARLIAAEAAQNDSLYAYEFTYQPPDSEPRTVTPNEMASLLAGERDPAVRRTLWECSKAIGPGLKPGLVQLQRLRNAAAREMGYSSFFGLEVADYGLSSAEMMSLMTELLAGMRPLYQQLHCWAKYELATRYGAEPPRKIPAHWLDNRWAQAWPGIVAGVDLDALLNGKEPAWLVQQAERFYVSLGMMNLPESFWERSDLYELPVDSGRKKNTHASAWHIDLDQDVRSLMSVKADYDWFTTTHHELGHIYYYLCYSRPGVPYVLRAGANRAFHEAIGTLIELASNQVPYLQEIGLLSSDTIPEQIPWLLNQALTGSVTFLPFACGTMTHFEHDLYEEDLPPELYNARWWEHAARFQGIEPPSPRDERFCDPATKTHISDDPAQYYDYALSEVILHQLHRHICREILHQDVRSSNYYNNKEIGAYLKSILEVGATHDWRELMIEATGERLSSQALLEYFAPLQVWLTQQNEGRDVAFD
jgi:peptidyl-dipeptidase A